MARSASGKIVLEVDPKLKARLYAVLGQENRTVKSWFSDQATAFCDAAIQPQLFQEKLQNHTISKNTVERSRLT